MNIAVAASFIGVITFLLSAVGVKVGSLFGAKYKSRAELAGGVILILMGLKILLEHLGSYRKKGARACPFQFQLKFNFRLFFTQSDK